MIETSEMWVAILAFIVLHLFVLLNVQKGAHEDGKELDPSWIPQDFDWLLDGHRYCWPNLGFWLSGSAIVWMFDKIPASAHWFVALVSIAFMAIVISMHYCILKSYAIKAKGKRSSTKS